MAQNADVQLALDTLIEMGVLNTAGLERLGQLFGGVQALGGVSAPGPRRRGRPRKTARNGAAKSKGRGPRGKAINKGQLVSMISNGMTGQAIADSLGVSLASVQSYKTKFGLAKKRKPGKKKARRKTAKKKSKNGRRRKGKK